MKVFFLIILCALSNVMAQGYDDDEQLPPVITQPPPVTQLPPATGAPPPPGELDGPIPGFPDGIPAPGAPGAVPPIVLPGMIEAMEPILGPLLDPYTLAAGGEMNGPPSLNGLNTLVITSQTNGIRGVNDFNNRGRMLITRFFGIFDGGRWYYGGIERECYETGNIIVGPTVVPICLEWGDWIRPGGELRFLRNDDGYKIGDDFPWIYQGRFRYCIQSATRSDGEPYCVRWGRYTDPQGIYGALDDAVYPNEPRVELPRPAQTTQPTQSTEPAQPTQPAQPTSAATQTTNTASEDNQSGFGLGPQTARQSIDVPPASIQDP